MLKRNCRKCILGFILLLFSVSLLANPAPSSLLLGVAINSKATKFVFAFKKSADGKLFLSSNALKLLRIKVNEKAEISIKHQSYYNLSKMGIGYKVNLQDLVVNLSVPSELFYPEKIKGSGVRRLKVSRPPFGAYMNYTVFTENSEALQTASGLFDTNVFSPYGEFNNTFSVSDHADPSHFVRLNSTFTHYDEKDLRVYRFGDALTSQNLWANSTSFAGVQLSSDFALNPYFQALPMPAVSGQAAVPSVVDVYVNNALELERNVNAGPFQISSLPVVSGQGNIRVVTTNSIGQQQVTTVPYYINNEMLKPGLVSYSYSLGLLRYDYGLKSAAYHNLAAVVNRKVGLTKKFTYEWRIEALERQQTLGAGFITVLPYVGTMTASAAESHDRDGVGSLAELGVNYQGESFSWGLNETYTTKHFIELGYDDGSQQIPALTSQAFAGIDAGDNSLSLSYVNQLYRGENSDDNVSLLTFGYNRTFHSKFNVSLSAVTNIGGQKAKQVFLGFSYLFGNNSINLSAQHNSSSNSANLQYAHNDSHQTGLSYYASVNDASPAYYAGGVQWDTKHGNAFVQYSHQTGRNDYQATLNGSLATVKRDFFIGQPISGSFGVVQVPNMADVGVYLDNNFVTKTDSKGLALIPNLTPFYSNTISLDPNTLPLSTDPSSYKSDVVPEKGAPAFLKFNIRKVHQVLFTLLQKNGEPVPVAAEMTMKGSSRSFVVGSKGEAYLATKSDQVRGQAKWENGQCDFKFDIKDNKSLLIKLGDIRCI